MGKPAIPFESGCVYHVWSHANGIENIFREEKNYMFFLKKYSQYLNPYVETYAYCLMPNHFHLMIEVREIELTDLEIEKRVSQGFSNLLNSYTQSLNKMYNRKGSLFIPNVKRNKISVDSYFTRCITYIHQNPAHHNFTKEFTNWKFSSWKSILSDKPTALSRDKVLSWFGGTEDFKKNHMKNSDNEVQKNWKLFNEFSKGFEPLENV
jgi:REP element-mobilizing transposase RayT